jgi:hypothetical protein
MTAAIMDAAHPTQGGMSKYNLVRRLGIAIGPDRPLVFPRGETRRYRAGPLGQQRDDLIDLGGRFTTVSITNDDLLQDVFS